jgi:hypothetical protein
LGDLAKDVIAAEAGWEAAVADLYTPCACRAENERCDALGPAGLGKLIALKFGLIEEKGTTFCARSTNLGLKSVT